MHFDGFIKTEKSWTDIKAIVAARNLNLQYEEFDDCYCIFATDRSTAFRCVLWKADAKATGIPSSNAADFADFESAFKSGANKAIVPRNALGSEIGALTFGESDGKDPQWDGYLHTAVAGETTNFDQLISPAKSIRGGMYQIFNPSDVADGDKIEFSIVDVDDVLKYGPGFVLKTYVRTEFVTPGYGDPVSFLASGKFDLADGLYMRTTYYSIGSVDIKFKTRIMSYA